MARVCRRQRARRSLVPRGVAGSVSDEPAAAGDEDDPCHPAPPTICPPRAASPCQREMPGRSRMATRSRATGRRSARPRQRAARTGAPSGRNLGVVVERHIAVSAAFRQVEHSPVVRSELDADGTPVDWRLGPQVDGHVPDTSPRATLDELGFSVRRPLEGKAPQCPATRVEGLRSLAQKPDTSPSQRTRRYTRPERTSPALGYRLEVDNERTRYGCRRQAHGQATPAPGSAISAAA